MMQMASRAIEGTRRQWQRLHLDERGSMIAFLAMLPVLLGAAAIGVETGQLYRVKRQMQSSADAAALAGSIDRIAGKTSAVITATAQYEAQRNGFTNGSNGVTVTVNAPPASGPNVTTTGAVEVIITRTTSFSLGAVLVNWLGGTPASFDMRVRSVAAQGSYSTTTTSYEACIVALTTAAEQGMRLSNFNNVTTDCTLASNGSAATNDSNASVYIAGGGPSSHLTANSIWSRGSIAYDASTSASLNNPAQPNQTAYITDPYASLADPVPGACTVTNYTPPAQQSLTMTPGTYCGGLAIDGTTTIVKNVDFTPGTYYVANGDLYLNHVNNVTCSTCVAGTSGVTIVLTQTTGNNADIGGFFIASDNTVTLIPPASGTYAGILAYQDRRAPVGTMASTAKIFTVTSLNNATLSGAMYFPNNRIDISNVNNFGGTCSIWVGRYIKFSNFNNAQKGGCATLNAQPVGVTTTTTVTKGKVVE